ncbi:MAG: hypothetical protein JSR33_04640 [Proteobacteria bacterium]|nr:hypothetical protein [Pseudomonadota bacterium]
MTYFNSTDEYVTLRLARIIPEQLKEFSDTTSWWQNFWEIIRTVIISGASSIGLTTTALRYPKFNSNTLQILWVIFIQLTNTALHALPVELVALKHFIYSLIFKPFFWLYESIARCFLSKEDQASRKYLAFEREKANELCGIIVNRLDSVFEQIVADSFDWNWLEGSMAKKFAYVKKSNAPIDTAKRLDISEILTYSSDEKLSAPKSKSVAPSYLQRTSEFLKTAASHLAYASGMVLVGMSCNGYAWDTPMSMQEGGVSEAAAIGLSSPAIYLLGVLLGHLGGVNMRADATRVGNALIGKGSMPVHAKIHTKSFAMAFCLNVYTALFSYAAAVRTVKDRLGGTPMEDISLFCSKYGIMYLSFSSFGEFYRNYVSQVVRFSNDENKLVAEMQKMKNSFKQYIYSMKPIKLAESLEKYLRSQYTETQVQHMFGISKDELSEKINFEELYQQEQSKKSPKHTTLNGGIQSTMLGRTKRGKGDDNNLTDPLNVAFGTV